ncbi:MAG: glycosyltransferase [Chthoniobacterales bacterium]
MKSDDARFAFRFDDPIEPVVFDDELRISGWLVDTTGAPIHGIRAISGRKTIAGRRKRHRPEVAAAYPNLAEARNSGFLVELPLRRGWNAIELQVRDAGKVWQTFHRGSVRSMPLKSLKRLGLHHTRGYLIDKLKPRRGTSSLRGGTIAQRTDPLRTKRVEMFATSKSNLFILEIAQLIAAGFSNAGFPTKLHIDEPPLEQASDDTLQLVVVPHEFYNLYLTQRMSRTRAEELTRTLVLLCTEQPDTPWFHSNLHWSGFARAFADINPLGVTAYRKRGIRCHHLQLGYDPLLAKLPTTAHRDRATDIVFLGSKTDRRDKFFAQHADFFAARHCHIRMVPIGFAKTKSTRSYLDTERRNELLSRAKILLNLHYSEQNYFEWHRMLVALANGCCVITETCQGYAPLEPGNHFVMVAPDQLIAACEYYLAHPAECERIANQGLDFLQRNLPQEKLCEAFLRELEATDSSRTNDEAALRAQSYSFFPIDAPSLPLPSQLQREPDSLGRALMKDVASLFQRRSPEKRTEQTLPTRSDDQARAEVVRRREAYRERLQAQSTAAEGGEPVIASRENAAWSHARSPTLSVVITLYNYAQFIEECVASVERAARELKQPLEIIIINDASTDASAAAASTLQDRSDLPIRLVTKKFNTGLADARNTGIQLARAPFVFILDADNLVFPTAFQHLLDAISSGDYVAAFSLLCRFRGTPENRVGLLSYYDWDPEILVQYPYIDAMAMFRRDALLEAGGYDNELSQIGWFGWEDYEMWLRFAHAGKHVAFVPNILCLYRHHETSMINTTNVFEVDLVNHLVAKYRELVEQFEPREFVFGVERHRTNAKRTTKKREGRFLIASGCDIATTSLYRTVHLQEQLRALGYEADRVDWSDESAIRADSAANADALVLYRLPMSSVLQRLIDQAQAAGKTVIFDTDDLVFEPELIEWHRAVQQLTPAERDQYTRDVRRYRETLAACDVATVATPFLAELAQQAGKTAFLHRNALGEEMAASAREVFDARQRSGNRVVIGYGSGTATHDIDFLEAAPALLQLLARFSQLEFWTVGPLNLPPEFAQFGERVRRFPLQDWRGWFELLAQIDIAIAPLERDNVFCRAKSEVKFIEAGALGVPLVASAIDAYERAIGDGESGFLAATSNDWVNKLAALIEDADLRAKIGANARRTVIDHYSPAARTADLAALLPQLHSASSRQLQIAGATR